MRTGSRTWKLRDNVAVIEIAYRTVIKTHGLNPINLEVRDPDASLKFYQQLFGVRECYRDEISIQVLGPGEKDVIAFVKSD